MNDIVAEGKSTPDNIASTPTTTLASCWDQRVVERSKTPDAKEVSPPPPVRTTTVFTIVGSKRRRPQLEDDSDHVCCFPGNQRHLIPHAHLCVSCASR